MYNNRIKIYVVKIIVKGEIFMNQSNIKTSA